MGQFTFCFVDIAGYTALTETHGAQTSADLIERFIALVRDNLPAGSKLVDRAGDEVFVVFHSASDALRFVKDLFAACDEEPNFPALRAGIHTGEALEQDGHYFGPGVNLAARMAARATGGQVLVTAESIAPLPDAGFEPIGAVSLKNIQSPVELVSLRPSGDSAETVVDPVCRMRVSPATACGRLRSGAHSYWFCSTECARLFAENPGAYTEIQAEPRAYREPRLPVGWGRVLLGIAIVAALALRISHIHDAAFEVDELQHLHAAYLVSKGRTPYVDFFEHHTPLFYWAAGAFIDPETADADTIISFRWGSLAAHVLTVALGAALAALVGVEAAIATTAFLLVEIFSFAWGTLSFLDSFAVPLLLAAAYLLARLPDARWVYLVSGCLIGAAILLTQKAVFAAPAAVSLVLLDAFRQPERAVSQSAARLSRLALGGLVLPLVFLYAALGGDGFAQFWSHTVELNAGWIARRAPLGELFIALVYNGPLWVLAAFGLLGFLRRSVGGPPASRTASVPVLFLAWLLVGAIVLPVVWYEYFIEIGPFVAIVAGIAGLDLARMARLAPGQPELLKFRTWLPPLAVVALGAVIALALVLRLANDHYAPTLTPSEILLLTMSTVALGWALAVAQRTGGRGEAALLVLALLCTLPVVNQASWAGRETNAPQRRAMAYIEENVGREERVLDGYSGFGVFRPHAYRYWFLHDEMLPMLSDKELSHDIVESLEDPRVRAVVRDEYLGELPPAVQRYVDEHFAPGRTPIWLRVDPLE